MANKTFSFAMCICWRWVKYENDKFNRKMYRTKIFRGFPTLCSHSSEIFKWFVISINKEIKMQMMNIYRIDINNYRIFAFLCVINIFMQSEKPLAQICTRNTKCPTTTIAKTATKTMEKKIVVKTNNVFVTNITANWINGNKRQILPLPSSHAIQSFFRSFVRAFSLSLSIFTMHTLAYQLCTRRRALASAK